MILIQDGSPELDARVRSKIGLFRRKKSDLTKCLKQIEIPDLLHMCAQCSKLPPITSTMDASKDYQRRKRGKQMRGKEDANRKGYVADNIDKANILIKSY